MKDTFVFEELQTVPVASLRDMTPYSHPQVTTDIHQAFPVPGEEFNFIRLDLSRAIIRHPAQTFFIQLTEDVLAGAGYLRGDIAIVDRQATPRNNDVIIAYLEGEFTIRRLKINDELLVLESDEETTEIEPDTVFSIWGVVKDVLR